MPTSAQGKPRLVVITGSTRLPSKSRTLGDAIAQGVAARTKVDVSFYDIADAGSGLGAAFYRKDLTPEALAVVEAIETADAVIAVTPVYKGSYPGLFKHLIDFVDHNSLVDRPVVIGATGGGHRHALMVEHQLRPLFGFFSALTIPTSVYASDHEFTDGVVTDAGVLQRIELASAQLASAIVARQVTLEHDHKLHHGRVDKIAV